MPPFNVGFAQVEDRLRVVRRRLNLLTVQHALYLSGSLVVLAAALLIALALRGRGSWFAVAVWFAAASAVAALTAAGLRVRQRWVSVPQVVHFADRHAALDDRLATLLLDPMHGRTSPLKPLLLQQILDAAPRWDVDTLVPRRVPRSLFALIGSLAALIVTAFLVRPPAIPSPIAPRSAPHANQLDGDTAEAQPRTQAARMAGDGQLGAGAAAGAIQVAGLSGASERGARGDASKPSQAGAVPDRAGQAGQRGDAASVSADQSGAQVGGAVPQAAADASPRDVTDKLQSAIRNAFGADTQSERKPAAAAGDRQDGRAGGERQEGRPAEEKPTSGDRPTGGGKPSLKDGATSSTGKPSNVSGHQAGAGSAPAAGIPSEQESEQLFGSAADARKVGAGSQNVSIRLGAFAALAPSQVEPQRRQPPTGEPVPSGASAASQPPLADEQVADAPLQKAEVAPQHEAVVRRIFTRDE